MEKINEKIRALQLNTHGLFSLLGDERLRFWEILKGITTPAEFRLVESQVDMIARLASQIHASTVELESAANAISGNKAVGR